jgi:quinol monooxygenase YgiN
MTKTQRSLVYLLVAAILAILAAPAWGQTDTRQYAVTYVDFKPADAKAGARVLDDLAAHALSRGGAVRFQVMQQVGRPNLFVLFGIWNHALAYEAYKSSLATQSILARLTPRLGAPLDERPGNLLGGSVPSPTRHAAARQIAVITHLDIIPTFVDQARPVLDKYMADSPGDPGVLTSAMLSWTPTTNHFQLVEVFADQRAYDSHLSAQHTVDFRTNLQPTIGAPYDARVYKVRPGSRPCGADTRHGDAAVQFGAIGQDQPAEIEDRIYPTYRVGDPIPTRYGRDQPPIEIAAGGRVLSRIDGNHQVLVYRLHKGETRDDALAKLDARALETNTDGVLRGRMAGQNGFGAITTGPDQLTAQDRDLGFVYLGETKVPPPTFETDTSSRLGAGQYVLLCNLRSHYDTRDMFALLDANPKKHKRKH